MTSIVVHFPRLGPYHIARLDAAGSALANAGLDLVAIETAGADVVYAWRQETQPRSWPRLTLFPDQAVERISRRQIASRMFDALDSVDPAAVAICGYANHDARAALSWCRRNDRIAVLMTETRHADGRRVWWKESLKRRVIRQFDAALCGGSEHKQYLQQLGMPAERIMYGYDVVDNDYFAAESQRWKALANTEDGASPTSKPCDRYFLASNRFLHRKNLDFLISAYHSFSANYTSHSECCWHLVLLGDGELKGQLVQRCRTLGLNVSVSAPWEVSVIAGEVRRVGPTVFFSGFRQIEELPRFYAYADCFVHPAVEEPWGLVLNEAMSCSLPVLASTGTGAATDLVDEGRNGWLFSPRDLDGLAETLGRFARLSPQVQRQMAEASFEIIQSRCPVTAFGKGLVAGVKAHGLGTG